MPFLLLLEDAMKSKVWLILKKEIRETFRDKKSLSMMLIIPFMIPLLIIGFSYLFESEMDKDISEYNKIGFAYEVTDAEKEIIKNLGIEPYYDSYENLEKKYNNGEIDLYVSKNGKKYIMNASSNDTSSYAMNLFENFFNTYKTYLQSEYLAQAGVESEEVLNILELATNINEEDNFTANYITVYAFMFIIMAITVSSTYPSTDATAGEKERGTLETLLTFPVKSKDIIIGKFLSVSLSSLITGFISLILMIISLKYANGAFKIYEGIDLSLPLSNILVTVLIIIAYSILISGLCIAVASKSKSFKEAQSALTPSTFISFFQA